MIRFREAPGQARSQAAGEGGSWARPARGRRGSHSGAGGTALWT